VKACPGDGGLGLGSSVLGTVHSVDVSQSPCFEGQWAMVKGIFFKNLKKYPQIQINVETH